MMGYISLEAFSIITILLIAIELLYFKVADKFNIIDKPNLRSSHTSVTLRGGGIIFLLGIWVYSLYYGFNYPYFLAGLTAIAGVSFIDDVRGVSNKIRLVVQFIAMFLMFQQYGILNLESWWIIIVALVLCVGIINAYNFMDGVNGMTGGYSMSVLISLIFMNETVKFVESEFLFVTIISVMIFNVFNFRDRARCFAGDVGAVGIAFIILFALGRLILYTGNFYYIMLLSVYGVDTIITIIHRIMLGENIGQAHRKHTYQLMANEQHTPHVIVSMMYTVIQCTVSFGMLFFPVNQMIYSIVALVVLITINLIYRKKYYWLHEEFLRGF